jgi:hypothetical protein
MLRGRNLPWLRLAFQIALIKVNAGKLACAIADFSMTGSELPGPCDAFVIEFPRSPKRST